MSRSFFDGYEYSFQIKAVLKEKATKVKRIFPEFKTKREVFDEKVYNRLL
jgi:hypothetical protein